MAQQKRTYFQEEWLEDPKFKGITAGKSSRSREASNNHPATSAYCIICRKTIGLSNMGRRAILSHVDGKKHQKGIRDHGKSVDIRMFTSCPASLGCQSTPVQSSTGTVKPQSSVVEEEENRCVHPANLALRTSSEVQLATTSNSRTALDITSNLVEEGAQGLGRINKYFIRDDVTKAEILWILHCCFNHSSMSSGGKAVKLFPAMFPDSMVAAKMELGRDKISYTLVYGLAPYFHEKLNDELKSCKFFVAMFDESLNKLAQQQQMDIAVRFWSSVSDEVTTQYYDSAFLGRTRAADLLEAFKTKLGDALLKRLGMISMDGPHVNFKFFKDLQIDMKETNGEDEPSLLFMGSCGIHVTHNAFKIGVKTTQWNIVQYLRCSYNIFKDVPARRSNYSAWTGSTKFPDKFCAVRWLNNASVAEKALKILPHIIKFVETVEKGGKELDINSASFNMVAKAVKEKMLGARLAYFAYVARIFEPFLTAYQTNQPMAPFLYTDLTALMSDLMKILVKKEVLSKTSNVHSVDLENTENLKPVKDITLGFTVKAELRKLKASDKEILTFKYECVSLLKKACSKLLEKSPLQYKLCKAITFCDPELICKSKDLSLTRLRSTLTIFQSNNWFSGNQCDDIERQFTVLIAKPGVQSTMQEYDRQRTRLDHHWRDILKSQACSGSLCEFMKMVLTFSHGNAYVERGFSVNKEIVVENQLTSSLVAQRQVYDGIQKAGGLENISIDTKMISRARHARSECAQARQERAKEEKEKVRKRVQERRVIDEVNELRAKKMKLLLEKQIETDAIDEKLKKLLASSK